MALYGKQDAKKICLRILLFAPVEAVCANWQEIVATI
jgi:hypothetical protein